MNAVEPTEWKPPKDAGAVVVDLRQYRARRSGRLTGDDAADLRYYFAGVHADLGVRSPQFEARLLLAPPREVHVPILEELDRHNGRCCEGKLIRLVVLEGLAVRSEVRRTLKRLERDDVVERVELPLPDVNPPRVQVVNPKTLEVTWESGRTNAEQLRIEDWTGFEIRRKASVRLALASLTPAERWRRQDEALEREHHICYGSETAHTSASYEPAVDDVQLGRWRRVNTALTRLAQRHVRVLEAMFRDRHASDEDELDAVRAVVGGDEEVARAAIERASVAYRQASP